MIKRLLLLPLALASLTVAVTASADNFRPKMSRPESYKDILYGVDEVHRNLDSVQCGGWVAGEQQVDGTSVTGDVPRPNNGDIIDLPGHQNPDPLGNAKTGVGVRGEFAFPDSARGYDSACDIHEDQIQDPDLQRLGIDLQIHEDGSVEAVAGDGHIDINPFHWCLLDDRADKATPMYCKRLFEAWKQMSELGDFCRDMEVCPGPVCEDQEICDDEGCHTESVCTDQPCRTENICTSIHPPIQSTCDCEAFAPEERDYCPPRPEKRYCFDPQYTFVCEGSSAVQEPVHSILQQDESNDVISTTDLPPQPLTCRTPWKPKIDNKMTECHFNKICEPDICHDETICGDECHTEEKCEDVCHEEEKCENECHTEEKCEDVCHEEEICDEDGCRTEEICEPECHDEEICEDGCRTEEICEPECHDEEICEEACHDEQFCTPGPCFYQEVTDEEGRHDAITASYYRHYAGDFSDLGVSVRAESGTGTVKTWNLRAECYEYYKGSVTDEDTGNGSGDFDPKDTITGGMDDAQNHEQCEIVLDGADQEHPENLQWPDGDGHAQKENVPAHTQTGSVRDERVAPDPWVTDSSTNLALTGTKKDRHTRFYDTDLAGLFGSIIPVKQRASETVADHARTDTFDDTDHRGLAGYWEAQQKILLQMVRDPTVRLIMPARFLTGLDDKNPLYQYVRGIVSRSDGIVELTLRGGPDDLGNALAALRSSYVLPITEVPIPILLPLVSIEDLDRLIFQWQQWQAQEEKQGSEFASQADPLIEKLRHYKDIILSERKLRGALNKEVTTLFEPIRVFDEFMAKWYKDNTEKIKEAAVQSNQRKQLKRIWRHLQNSMLQADTCQLQWCSNMRYSVPIYSLLDGWWQEEEAAAGDARNLDYVPPDDLRTIEFTPPKDQLYDFSFLDLPRGQFRIPVLSPTQVKVNLPLPPQSRSPVQNPEDFPDLPSLPDASVFDGFPVPEVHLPEERVLEVEVEASDLGPVKEVLRAFRQIIDGTSIDDQIAQEESEDSNGGILEDEGPYEPPYDRTSMRGAYCRFVRSILISPDANEENPGDDQHGDPEKIVHVEGDLKERVARLFSRWMPILPEDRAGRTARLNEEFPDPDVPPTCKEDVICAFLLGERTTMVPWKLFFPDQTTDFTALRENMKSQTLPQTDDENPYLHAPVSLLKRLFPSIDLPITIDLTVQ